MPRRSRRTSRPSSAHGSAERVPRVPVGPKGCPGTRSAKARPGLEWDRGERKRRSTPRISVPNACARATVSADPLECHRFGAELDPSSFNLAAGWCATLGKTAEPSWSALGVSAPMSAGSWPNYGDSGRPGNRKGKGFTFAGNPSALFESSGFLSAAGEVRQALLGIGKPAANRMPGGRGGEVRPEFGGM